MLTDKQWRAMGRDGEKAIIDYWWGKCLAVLAFGFIVVAAVLWVMAMRAAEAKQ